MAELTPENIAEFVKALEGSGIAKDVTLRRLVKVMGGNTEGLAKALKLTGKEAKSTAKKLGELSDELEETSDGLTALQRVNNILSMGIGTVTGNLSSLGSSTRMLGEQFGEMGSLVGDTLGYLVERLNENVDFYRSISQIGGAAGQSISNLRKISGETGLSMSQLTDAITSAGGNLALLGGTTGQGVKRFTGALRDLAQGETFEKFSALGFTMQEIAQGTAEYLELQTQLGRAQTMTERELSTETAGYLNQLDLLSRLTGKNRQALQQEMQERAKDKRLSLQLAGMDQKQRNEINGALSMTSNVSKEMENSIRNLIATDGVAMNAREAGILEINGMREAIHGLARGETGSAQQLMSVFKTAADETANMTAEDRQRTAQLKQLGVDFFDVRFETLGFKNVLGDLQVATEEQAKAQEVGTKSALQFDRSTQRLRTAFQALLAPITDLLSGVIGGLAVAIEGMAAGINGLKNIFGELGGSIAGVIALIGTGVAGKMAMGYGGGAVSSGVGKIKGLFGSKKSNTSVLSKGSAGGGGLLAGMGGGLKGLAGGLTAMANPATLLGAANLGLAITAVGAGVAAATWLMGGALGKFAEGLGHIGEVDGSNLVQVAKGTLALSGAMVAMGAGSAVGTVGGFMSRIFGGGSENFAKNLNKTLDELDKSKIDMYANSIENLGTAMTSLRSGMMGTTTASASTTGDKLDQLNNTMQQILMAMGDNNRYSRITSQATTEVADTV